MDYSQKTQDLIDRQCRNVERQDFSPTIYSQEFIQQQEAKKQMSFL